MLSVHLLSAGPANSGCNFEFGWTDKIPDNAFTGMSKLQSVQLPSTVTEIGVGVFSSSDLTSINLPKSLKTIRASAFNGCIDLEEVYYAGTEADWKIITIENWNDPLTRATIHYGPAPIETGWEKADDGSWQYWNPDGSYVAADWKNIDGKWYHFDKDGRMQTGWQKISGEWYYFESGGTMKTGWVWYGGKWYYTDSSGVMVTGSRKIDGKTYNFDSSGVCLNP